ncbi:MAG: carboxypeptidase-like regulatory domain-containing protein, partial [Planctomycetota bacterium]
MSTRLALPAALLALLAVLFLVFQGGPDGGFGDDGRRTGGTTQEPAAGERPDQGTGGDDDRGPDRTELEATDPTGGDELAEAAASLHAFSGFVVDLEGRPLASASVRALGFTRWNDRDDSRALVEWEAETAADGSFQLPTPRDNLFFTLEVRAAEHAPRELRNQRASPGRTRDLGEIRLDRGFTLSGQVVDPRGLPVAEARVQAYRDPQHPRGAEALLGLPPLEGFEAVTDREGNFTLALLPQGAIRLRAEAEGYFESWSGIASAIPDTEAAGMVIHLREGARVFGVVLDQGRRPVAGARVQVESRGSALDDTYRVETEAADDGSFTLTVPGAFDRITLTAASDGFFVERRRLRESQV